MKAVPSYTTFEIMIIDAHHHFWYYDPERDAWITDAMQAIQRDFLPEDFLPILQDNNVDGVLSVQASQSEEETHFLVELAAKNSVVKGVVGWVDLASPEIEQLLQSFKTAPIIKGFRHVVEGEDDGDFLMRAEIQRGIKALTRHGYTYDLLIRPRHYESTLQCVRENPDQQFILDHMAKPNVKDQDIDAWKVFITELSQYPNVACKVSGLATEADWKTWQYADFTPVIDHVATCFGVQRLMYGSDWPVCNLAATYQQNMEIKKVHVKDWSEADQAAFWGGNAQRIYNL